MSDSEQDAFLPTVGIVVPGHFIPPTNGGQKVCYEFCSALTKKTNVFCFSTHTENTSHHLNLKKLFSSSRLRYLNISLVWKLARFLKGNHVRFCIVNQPYFGLLAFLACKSAGCELITYAHNLEFKRSDGLKKYMKPLTFLLELVVFHLSWRVLFISKSELYEARKYFLLSDNRCIYIPHIVTGHGVGTILEPSNNRPFTLVFFGNFIYPPNRRALDALFQDIMPLLLLRLTFPCRLIIFGSNLPKTIRSGQLNSYLSLEILGYIDDPATILQQADIMLSPVLDGTGVQIKIIEAISLGITVISTKSGTRGIDQAIAGAKLKCVEDRNWDGFVQEIFHIKNESLHTLKTPDSFFDTHSERAVVAKVLDSMRPN